MTFQVTAPPIPPGSPQVGTVIQPPTEDEISRFIHRQMYIIKSDEVLQHALESEAFQHDPNDPSNPTKKSRWLTDNGSAAKRYLKKDLEVIPDPSSDLFMVTMTAKNDLRRRALVNAIATVYMKKLQDDSSHEQERAPEQLGELLRSQGTK